MKRLILTLLLTAVSGLANAQERESRFEQQQISIEPNDQIPIYDLLSEERRAQMIARFMAKLRRNAIDSTVDSTDDSTVFEVNSGGWKKKRRGNKRSFLITELERTREYSYREPFSLIDFNRVDGFFLGIGTASMTDFGKHDELGINGGYGYAFADKRVQYFLGGEYRIPTKSWDNERDTINYPLLFIPPTIAIGAEFHNLTATEDFWRMKRLENAAMAFFAREDFRDYFKLAGWSASVAYRFVKNVEAKVEWRNDNYESRSQTVYRGRFGGNKVLPVNPAIDDGRYHSVVLTYQHERTAKNSMRVANLVGDSVEMDYLDGLTAVVQTELAHLSGNPKGFNRYLADIRYFWPVLPALALDSRLRYEAGTGDVPVQKAQYLGGPSSLPALRNKELSGNRLLLLNTELRFNLVMLSSFFNGPDLQLVLLNDFGYVGYAAPGRGMEQGFDLETSKIKHNIGLALGLVNGVQIGATWRTDRKADAQFLLRLARPF